MSFFVRMYHVRYSFKIACNNIKSMAIPVLQHRIALTPDVEIEGLTASNILTQLLNDIEAPRQ